MSALDPDELSRARDELLRRLYVAYFTTSDHFKFREVQQEQGWEEQLLWRAFRDLSEDNLVKQVDSGHFEIKPAGILQAERRKLPPAELVSKNHSVRPLILAKYAETHEAKGWHGERDSREVIRAISTEVGLDEVLVFANHELLSILHEIEHDRSPDFKITKSGLATVRKWKERVGLHKRFEELQSWTGAHQERGRQFQSLLGQLANDAGWRVDESVLGPGEETDLVLHRDDSFYMLECRWKKEGKLVGAKEIRDFAGKLQKRAAVGVFVSISGYTADAVQEVEAVTGQTPIILVGPGEIADCFSGALRFNDMLTEKKRSLVLQRKAPWK